MSFRASRLPDPQDIEQFNWVPVAGRISPPTPQVPPEPPAGPPDHAVRVADIERDAFDKGFAQGERAGAEAATAWNESMLRTLVQSVEELSSFRAEVIRRTERQAVQLVLALAERVVHREITLDRSILVGMARAALDRLGEVSSATIRLNPDDYAALSPGKVSNEGQARIVADPKVDKGGCRVQSDFGFMDSSPEAQFRELARALLSDDGPACNGESHRGLVAT